MLTVFENANAESTLIFTVLAKAYAASAVIFAVLALLNAKFANAITSTPPS